MNKKYYDSDGIKLHAKKQFRNRMKVTLTEELHNNIILAINKGYPHSQLVERQTKNISIHKINFRGESWHIVYDRHYNIIKTCLYPEWNYSKENKKVQ